MSLTETEVLERVMLCTGTSDRDLAEMAGTEFPDGGTLDAVGSLVSSGCVERRCDVIGYRRGGRPSGGGGFTPPLTARPGA